MNDINIFVASPLFPSLSYVAPDHRILAGRVHKNPTKTSCSPSSGQPLTRDAVATIQGLPPQPSKTLRRRPKLESTASLQVLPERGIPRLPKSPSVPLFHDSGLQDYRPLTSGDPPLRPQLSYSNRSPTHRRPPASHSSYGVETFLGPPPSYSTQRTLSQDRIWTLQRQIISYDLNDGHQADEDASSSRIATIEDRRAAGDISSPETLETQSIATPDLEDVIEPIVEMSANELEYLEDQEDHDHTLRVHGKTRADADSKGSSSDDRKSEDLFLNIARSDAPRSSPVDGPKKKRSRISLPFLPVSRAVRTDKPQSPSLQSDVDPSPPSPRVEISEFLDKRSSLGQRTLTSISVHPLDGPQSPRTQGETSRAQSSATRSVAGGAGRTYDPSRQHSRRTSHHARDFGTGVSQHTAEGLRSPQMVSESIAAQRSRWPDHNATESTISTTAPSTVWDELDDLKSRIRKLELTGKLPSSSAAAMSSAERPRTATTAATTMSSSPMNKPTVASLQAAIEGIPTTIHPLLHEALGQAKPVLSNEVYQKLQTTASDALQLVALMSGELSHSGQESTVGMAMSQDRHLRRRAESMCRGLTELTIAISAESKAVQSPPYRPASRDANSRMTNHTVHRSNLNKTDETSMPSRVQSRLAHRFSGLSSRNDFPSPSATVHTPIIQNQHRSPSLVLPRTSTLTRSRQNQRYYDGTSDEYVDSPPIRPVSRAMTELGGAYRRSARDRTSLSREYTSQHPMPTQVDPLPVQRTPLPSGLGSNFNSRRKHVSPANVIRSRDSSPRTPSEVYGQISAVSNGTSSSTPATGSATRTSGSRRSFGLASRIGSSVGSRLRAVRAERNTNVRDGDQKQESPGEVVQSLQAVEDAAQESAPTVPVSNE